MADQAAVRRPRNGQGSVSCHLLPFALASLLIATSASAQPTSQPAQQSAAPEQTSGILLIFPYEDSDISKFKPNLFNGVIKTPTELRAVIDSSALAKSFSDFVQKVGAVFSVSNPILPGGYVVDEVQLQLNITAEGSFGLIASGKLGTTGGISIVLRRPTTSTARP
jgi:hypothetical protein